MSKTSTLSLTCFGNRFTSVYSENDALDSVCNSLARSKNWECYYDEYGTLTCFNLHFLKNGSLYIFISSSGYMKIRVYDIEFPKVDNPFMLILQKLFSKKKITLWKGYITPKDAKYRYVSCKPNGDAIFVNGISLWFQFFVFYKYLQFFRLFY